MLVFTQTLGQIDNLHVVRCMYKSIMKSGFGPKQMSFYNGSEAATSLRNYLNHLGGNINNLANRKGPQLPIYGSLSWFVVDESDIDQFSQPVTIKSGTSVSLAAGSVFLDSLKAGIVDPLSHTLELPVDLFELSASRFKLSMSSCLRLLKISLASWVPLIEDIISKSVPPDLYGDSIGLYGTTLAVDFAFN